MVQVNWQHFKSRGATAHCMSLPPSDTFVTYVVNWQSDCNNNTSRWFVLFSQSDCTHVFSRLGTLTRHYFFPRKHTQTRVKLLFLYFYRLFSYLE